MGIHLVGGMFLTWFPSQVHIFWTLFEQVVYMELLSESLHNSKVTIASRKLGCKRLWPLLCKLGWSLGLSLVGTLQCRGVPPTRGTPTQDVLWEMEHQVVLDQKGTHPFPGTGLG